MQAGFCQSCRRAEVAGRELGEYRRIHDLSRALAGHSAIHAVSSARVSQDVPERLLPAEYVANDRPAGEGRISDRSVGGRGALGSPYSTIAPLRRSLAYFASARKRYRPCTNLP